MKHRNDGYGSTEKQAQADFPPAIPAATVILLRQRQNEPQVLMLHKNLEIDFGGLWVFPGGRIDAEDSDESGDADAAARNAAVRETIEEAGINIPGEDFILFSHWTPPPREGRRYATWFFVTSTEEEHDIQVDGEEIQNHQWINPKEALAKHATGEIDLVPPTWVTLYTLAQFESVEETLTTLKTRETRHYETHLGKDADGIRITMWSGDSGYENWDASISDETHRLIMSPDGFEFQHSAVDY